MLIQMRSKIAKVFMFFLFGILILSFAVWGIEDVFLSRGQQTAIAEVGDTEIPQTEFARLLNREMNILRRRFGGQFDITLARSLGLVDQVIDQLVTRAMFEQQAKDMGLTVTEDQIRQRILEEPAFQNNLGDFERGRFQQVLASNNLTEQQYVRSLGLAIGQQQIVEAVSGASEAPQDLATALYLFEQERRIAETIQVPLAELPEDAAPTEDDLMALYEANTPSFQAPEYRSIVFLALDAEGIAEGIEITEEVLRSEFELRRADFSQPERRTIEQMVFSSEEEARTAEERLSGGEAFAAVSQNLLERTPVGLGQLSEAELSQQLPAVVDAVFALDEGAVSAPVQSPFGWHLMRVVKIDPAREPTFEEARAELSQDLAMREAVDAMLELADSLDDELAAGASIEEAADTVDLPVRSLPAVDRSGQDKEGERVSDLPTGAEFMQTAFQTELGETSLLTATRDGNYFVLRVDGITESTTRPFEEVRSDVLEIWRGEERDRRTRERAEGLAERAREGVELSAIAEGESLVSSTTEPLIRDPRQTESAASRAIAAQLFEMAQGDIAVVATPEGQVVAKLTQIQSADPEADPDAVGRLRAQLAEDLQNDLLAGFVATMRNEFGVTIDQRAVENAIPAY